MAVDTARKPAERWVVQISPRERDIEPGCPEKIANRRNELPGIPDGRKEVNFGRVDRDSSRLGLPWPWSILVDKLVIGFGGEVAVENTSTGGAAFVVRLARADGLVLFPDW